MKRTSTSPFAFSPTSYPPNPSHPPHLPTFHPSSSSHIRSLLCWELAEFLVVINAPVNELDRSAVGKLELVRSGIRTGQHRRLKLSALAHITLLPTPSLLSVLAALLSAMSVCKLKIYVREKDTDNEKLSHSLSHTHTHKPTHTRIDLTHLSSSISFLVYHFHIYLYSSIVYIYSIFKWRHSKCKLLIVDNWIYPYQPRSEWIKMSDVCLLVVRAGIRRLRHTHVTPASPGIRQLSDVGKGGTYYTRPSLKDLNR